MHSLRLQRIELLSLNGSIDIKNKGGIVSGTAPSSLAPINLNVSFPRNLAVTELKILLKNETDGQKHEYQALWTDLKDACDIFTIELNLKASLYYFYLVLDTPLGKIYGYKGRSNVITLTTSTEGSHFQLSAVNFKYSEPKGFSGGIIYHIFVDRFARSGKTNVRPGGVKADYSQGMPEYPAYPGAPMKNNSFWGGDLYGVIEKLDYICSLGANIIYLSPIFDSPSNHKYDTGNYLKVDESFGGFDALEKLINEAHLRGMKIILDGVFNHTGADSVYFNKYGNYDSLGAYQSKSSKYYDWYEFSQHPDKYTSWWDIDILPRINTRLKECSDFFIGKDGVIPKYIRMGIDGFRLDVVDELSDEFISKIKSRMESVTDGTILYGEVWEDASNKIAYSERKRYFLGEELDGVMNYPLRSGIIDYLLYSSTDTLDYALSEVMSNAPKRIRDLQMNLLGTHDTERILTVLSGDKAQGLSNDVLAHMRLSGELYAIAKRRLMLAYTILATLPGIPSIFYGDEAGLEGYGDPFNRMPYPWTKEDKEILDFYKKIGIIRREESIYGNGDFCLISLTPYQLIFSRKKNTRTLLTVINNSRESLDVEFTKTVFAKISGVSSLRFVIEPYSPEIFLSDIPETYLIINNIKE